MCIDKDMPRKIKVFNIYIRESKQETEEFYQQKQTQLFHEESMHWFDSHSVKQIEQL